MSTRETNHPNPSEERLGEGGGIYRLAFQTCSDPFTFSRISDGVLTEANDAFCRVTGFTREEALGRTSFELGLWRDPADRKRMISALTSVGFIENLEARFGAKDGGTLIGLVSARLLRIGSEDMIFAITRDITGRRRAQEALQESAIGFHRNESFLDAILRLDRMAEETVDEITLFTLEEAVQQTQSGISQVVFLDADERVQSMRGWSGEGDPFESGAATGGLWDEALERRRAVITNDPDGRPTLRMEDPEGEIPIARRMSVPIFQKDRIVLVAGVANASRRYDEFDVRRLTLLMTGLWRIIQRKRSEEALRESEEKFSMAFKHAPVPTTITEWESGTFLDVNEKFLEVTGFTREETLGRTPVEMGLMGASDRLRLLGTLRRRGKVSGLELTARHKGGAPLYFLHHCEMVTIGGVKRLLTMTMDVTAHKGAQKELIRLAAALEQAGEAIFIAAPDWTIMYVNPAFERLTGYGCEEIVGRHTRALRSHQHDNGFYQAMRETLGRAEVWSGRIINKRKDGSHYEAEATVSPIRDKSGAVINYVSIQRDITREVKLMAELQQARKMEAIGLLAGGIAHDFNNILAAIMGFTELSLLKISADSPVRRNLELVLKASVRASEVVKQILTFTRRGVTERKLTAMGPIVSDTLKFLRSSLPSTIEICETIEVGGGEDVVLAEPGRINEVLMNLGANAAHAMKGKGGRLSVKLSRVADAASHFEVPSGLDGGPWLRLMVSDTGHGMDSAVLERIFDPYFTTKAQGEGTGLGLSVVQGIVKAHGGAITVRSQPGKGAAFFVFLPLHEAAKAVEDNPPAPIPTGNERILLVDDEETLVVMCRQMLEMLGYRVTAMTNSLEALEVFRARPGAFDLVITDMTMPHLTGKELTEKILALRSDIPVILSTGFSDPLNENQAKEAGVRGLILKPYELHTLAAGVRKALEKGSVLYQD